MLLSQYAPIKIGSIPFIAVSEGPACCCGLAHEVLDDQQYFAFAGARAEILQPRDGGVSGRRRAFHVGAGVRRPRRGATVTASIAHAHSPPQLWPPRRGTRDASSLRYVQVVQTRSWLDRTSQLRS